MSERILVIGANGQIGSELTLELRRKYGDENVTASDIAEPIPILRTGNFEQLDVLDDKRLRELLTDRRITIVYHMAALLSATGERNPMLAWHLNMDGLLNVLNASVHLKLSKVFWPSSIAAFGPDAPKEHTPQRTAMNPTSMYGITKVAGEQLCAWYHRKHALDVRSLRYPGLISHKTMPGGGTTDYAIEIFHAALQEHQYTCYLKPDATLPFMYMDDAVRGTMELMAADTARITVRTSYNFTAFSLSPKELASEIAHHVPNFLVNYEPDFRQQFAESWPRNIDDSSARQDWQWQPRFDLPALVSDMLKNVALMQTRAV